MEKDDKKETSSSSSSDVTSKEKSHMDVLYENRLRKYYPMLHFRFGRLEGREAALEFQKKILVNILEDTKMI